MNFILTFLVSILADDSATLTKNGPMVRETDMGYWERRCREIW